MSSFSNTKFLGFSLYGSKVFLPHLTILLCQYFFIPYISYANSKIELFISSSDFPGTSNILDSISKNKFSAFFSASIKLVNVEFNF